MENVFHTLTILVKTTICKTINNIFLLFIKCFMYFVKRKYDNLRCTSYLIFKMEHYKKYRFQVELIFHTLKKILLYVHTVFSGV